MPELRTARENARLEIGSQRGRNSHHIDVLGIYDLQGLSYGRTELLVAALMFVVCLSGTIAVFYPELERWEQPGVAESTAWDPATLEAGFNRFLADPERLTPHMSLYLPTADFPRTRMANEEAAWLVGADGFPGERERHPYTHLLTNVHLYLTLPQSWGMILVSALGALLFALVVSGFLACIGYKVLKAAVEVAQAVRGHLQFLYGTDTSGWELVARYPIHGALPSMRGPLTVAGSGEHGPVIVAGDHCATASIQGAMISGRHAADAACRRLGVVRPDDRRIAV